MKKTIHVHEVVVIDKDVSHCGECPYYYEERDMGATHSCCEKRREKFNSPYSEIIPDVCWRDSNKKISKECPLF